MEQLKIPFVLNDIVTKQWASFPKNQVESAKTSLDFEFDFIVNPSINKVHCEPRLTILNDDKTVAVLEMGFEFLIEKKAWDSLNKDGKLTIPRGLKEHFLVLCLGTMRGVLFEKTQADSEQLKKIVFPTINLRRNTGDDIVFDIVPDKK